MTKKETTQIIAASAALLVLGGLGLAFAYRRRQRRKRLEKSIAIHLT